MSGGYSWTQKTPPIIRMSGDYWWMHNTYL